VPAMNKTAACPVLSNVISCRPPLAAESSENRTGALGAACGVAMSSIVVTPH